LTGGAAALRADWRSVGTEEQRRCALTGGVAVRDIAAATQGDESVVRREVDVSEWAAGGLKASKWKTVGPDQNGLDEK
jgi:hypothetical protein